MEGVPSSNGYRPGFMVELMVKDLGLAMEVARTAGVEAHMGSLAHTLYAEHRDAGHGAMDFSGIMARYGGGLD